MFVVAMNGSNTVSAQV